jgi:tripartite-type tricarboxylate transporter receptor subunit TctC
MTTRLTSPARRKLVATAALSLAASLATLAPAQSWAQAAWPNKAVRIVVPYAPGGANDILARVVAEKLAPALGQPVLVENKPGAGAAVGTEFVVKAAPDGYAHGGQWPHHSPGWWPSCPTTDHRPGAYFFAPIPMILAVNEASPAKTFNDLLFVPPTPTKAITLPRLPFSW